MAHVFSGDADGDEQAVHQLISRKTGRWLTSSGLSCPDRCQAPAGGFRHELSLLVAGPAVGSRFQFCSIGEGPGR
jgi:hypothetical protein